MTTTEGSRHPGDDRALFAGLRRLWAHRDPMPSDLVDNVLITLATQGLGAEYAILTLLESTRQLAGIRGHSATQIFEFAHGDMSIMLRVSPLSDSRRRVDGWIAPALPLSVRLHQGDDYLTTTASADGRFEFADVSAGPTRMLLRPDPPDATTGITDKGFTTRLFEL